MSEIGKFKAIETAASVDTDSKSDTITWVAPNAHVFKEHISCMLMTCAATAAASLSQLPLHTFFSPTFLYPFNLSTW